MVHFLLMPGQLIKQKQHSIFPISALQKVLLGRHMLLFQKQGRPNAYPIDERGKAKTMKKKNERWI